MKYLIIFSVSAALQFVAILALGYQIDGSTVFAVLVASCLPVWAAQEYRAELWPERRVKAPEPVRETVAAPVPLRVRVKTRLSGIGAWHRPTSPAFAPTLLER